jgi:hypothetical protein
MSNHKRRLVSSVIVAAAAGAAILGTASAANAGPVSVETCTSVTGATTYQPGLTTNTRTETAVLSATLGGCSNAYNGASPGAGALTANLTGPASTTAVALKGAFVVNWPAASGFNPSTGTLGVTGPNAQGVYTVSGTITGGAFTGSTVSTSLLGTGVNAGADGSVQHPITAQQFTNTAALQVRHSNWYTRQLPTASRPIRPGRGSRLAGSRHRCGRGQPEPLWIVRAWSGTSGGCAASP